MPAKPQWYGRLSSIISTLQEVRSPVLDRGCIEQLFGVRRRRALMLMEEFGAFIVAGVFVLDRMELIRRLQEQAGSDEVRWECQRGRRVGALLEHAREHDAARRIKIPVKPDVYRQTMEQLPSDIHFEAGTLRIRYVDGEDLLVKLFGLAQAISNDFQTFEQTTGGVSSNKRNA